MWLCWLSLQFCACFGLQSVPTTPSKPKLESKTSEVTSRSTVVPTTSATETKHSPQSTTALFSLTRISRQTPRDRMSPSSLPPPAVTHPTTQIIRSSTASPTSPTSPTELAPQPTLLSSQVSAVVWNNTAQPENSTRRTPQGPQPETVVAKSHFVLDTTMGTIGAFCSILSAVVLLTCLYRRRNMRERVQVLVCSL